MPANAPAPKNSSADISREENFNKLKEKYNNVNGKHYLLSGFGTTTKNGLFASRALSGPLLKGVNNDIFEKNTPHELYKSGKCTYNQALHKIDVMEKTTDITYGLLVNIATSLFATSLGLTLKGKFKLPMPAIAAIGAGVGAITKVGINFIDRFKNNVEGDEFNSKLLLKDALTGAANGLLSGVNAGFGKEFNGVSVLKKIGFEAGKQGAMIASAKILADKENKKE